MLYLTLEIICIVTVLFANQLASENLPVIAMSKQRSLKHSILYPCKDHSCQRHQIIPTHCLLQLNLVDLVPPSGKDGRARRASSIALPLDQMRNEFMSSESH